MEAQSTATPLCKVSTRCGGPEEFVLEGRTGLFTEARPAAMAAAIAAVCDDRQQRDSLGDGARTWIEAHADNRAGCATIRNQWCHLYPHAPLGN